MPTAGHDKFYVVVHFVGQMMILKLLENLAEICVNFQHKLYFFYAYIGGICIDFLNN